jgi:hypothetical protein
MMENDAKYCRAQAAKCKRLANLTSAQDVRAFLLEKGRDWLKAADTLERGEPNQDERTGNIAGRATH